MPLLYEPEIISRKTTYILKAKLSRSLTSSEVQRLRNVKSLMEQKANIYIHRIATTPKAILIYYSPTRTQKFIVFLTAIAIIAAAVGLPITAWLLTAPPPGPLGLPTIFWIGVGVGIPLIALGTLVWMMKK